MTYEELVEKVKKTYESADAKEIKEHVAVQFNVEGEAEGAFYLEVADGKVKVEPFEYYDHDVVVITSAAVISDIADGKTDIETAYNSGSLRAEGNVGKALLLKELKVKKKATKATTAKTATKTVAKTTKKDDTKTTAKKTTKKAEVKETAEAKKAEVKEAAKEEKKEVKKEAKAEEKTTAKKTAAAKTTKKSTK